MTMRTVSIRLGEEEIKKIQALSRQDKKDKSMVIRELIRQGLVYRFLQEYREGRKSLGTLADDLGISLSATIDLLAELGIESPLEYKDYLESLGALRHVE